jgi:ubiquinone/menaquinone biosynthesis C-methylase UbiE
MSTTRTNPEYYDRVSAAYDRAREGSYHALMDRLAVEAVQHAAAAVAREHNAAPPRVLEAGCGTGRVLSRLRAAGLPAVGLDLSLGMLNHARSRGLPAGRADLTVLPVADASLDLVCCFKVLPHVPRLATALEEFARVLKPGGRMVIETYNPHSLRALVKRFGGPQRIVGSTDEGEVATRYDGVAELRAATPTGATLEQIRGARVLTPLAAMHDWPLLGPLLGALEAHSADGPLARFAGFLIATYRKRG